MERDWGTTITWMATLCDTSVRVLTYFVLLFARSIGYGMCHPLTHPRMTTPLHAPQPFDSFFSFSDRPEPHILLFRRPLGTDPQSGAVVPELLAAAREEYKHQFGLRK